MLYKQECMLQCVLLQMLPPTVHAGACTKQQSIEQSIRLQALRGLTARNPCAYFSKAYQSGIPQSSTSPQWGIGQCFISRNVHCSCMIFHGWCSQTGFLLFIFLLKAFLFLNASFSFFDAVTKASFFFQVTYVFSHLDMYA